MKKKKQKTFTHIVENNSCTYVDECMCLECICDDSGVYFICSECGKAYRDELNASLCCLPD